MTTTKPISLKPGFLISLKTSIAGGIEYRRTDLDAGEEKTEGAEVTRWETTRVVEDAAEWARAQKVRSRVSNLIRSVCTASDFGLLCSADKEQELDDAYAEARRIAEEHNANANLTRIHVYLLKGRIAQTDEAAMQAIGSEVRALIEEMKTGLEKANPTAIREAASRARKLNQMLSDEAQVKVSKAIEEARSAARAIVKRVETDGEDAALVIQELSRKALDEARFAFLDFGSEDVGGSGAGPAPSLDLGAAGSDAV